MRQYKKFLKISLVFILGTFITLSFWDFSVQMNQYAKNSKKLQLQEFAMQMSNAVRIKIEDSMQYMKAIAKTFASYENLHSDTSLKLLEDITSDSYFGRIRLTTPDGVSYAAPGNMINISNRDYFKYAMAGKSGISDVMISLYNNRLIYNVYVPIYQNGKIVGTTHGAYEVENLSNEINMSMFDGRGFVQILQSDGTVILGSDKAKDMILGQNNAWDFYSKLEYVNDTSYNKMYDDIQNQKSGFTFFNLSDKMQFGYYTPVGINDWYIFQVLPESVLNDYKNPAMRQGLLLILKVSCLLGIISVCIMYFGYKSNRKILNTSRQLDSLTNAIPGGVYKCTMDEKREFIYISDGFSKICGYTREEIKEIFKNSFYNMIYPEDRFHIREILVNHMEQGEVVELNYRIQTKDGRILWVLDRSFLTCDFQEKQYYSICLDISDRKEIEQELKVSSERFKIAAFHMVNSIFDYDMDSDRIVFFEKAKGMEKIADVIADIPEHGIDTTVISEIQGKALLTMFEQIKNGESSREESVRLQIGPEQYRWYMITVTNVYDENGKPVRAIGTVIDETDKKEIELQYEQEVKLRATMLADLLLAYEINISTDEFITIRLNKEGKKQESVKRPYTSTVSNYLKESIYPEDREKFMEIADKQKLIGFYKNGHREMYLEYRFMKEQGNFLWVSSTSHLLKDPATGELKCFSYIRDIHKQKEKEFELQRKAERDPLTGLYNRGSGERLIRQYLGDKRGYDGREGFLSIDLDGFKEVNDKFGHIFGDEVLKKVADILNECLRADDIVIRQGGDEFIVFLKGVRDREHIQSLAGELCKAVYSLNDKMKGGLHISTSIGIAMVPEDGDVYEELYKKSDMALYYAKHQGRNRYEIYHEKIQSALKREGFSV